MRRVLGRSYALNVQLSSQPSTARSSPALEDGKPLLVVGARKKEKKKRILSVIPLAQQLESCVNGRN